MTDHTLSSLRRRARQTGTVEDDSALLVARLRAGTLTRERLEMAAYCGDEAARAVVGAPRPVAPALPPLPCPGSEGSWHAAPSGACFCGYGYDAHVNPDKNPRLARELGLGAWLRGLSRWADLGPAPGWVLVRAAVAATRAALPIHEAAKTTISYDAGLRSMRIAPRRAIEAAEAWLACPCGKHREDLLAAVLSRRGAHFRDPCARCGTPHDDVAPGPCPGLPAWALGCSDVLFADGVHENGAPVWHRGPRGAARLAGEQPVREAICRSLVEWALSEDA